MGRQFPRESETTHHRVRATITVKLNLYCHCHMPWRPSDNKVRGMAMAECEICLKWFHQKCEIIPDSMVAPGLVTTVQPAAEQQWQFILTAQRRLPLTAACRWHHLKCIWISFLGFFYTRSFLWYVSVFFLFSLLRSIKSQMNNNKKEKLWSSKCKFSLLTPSIARASSVIVSSFILYH